MERTNTLKMDWSGIRTVLGWCAVINFGLLMVSWVLYMVCHQWIYDIWSSLYGMSMETYDLLYISVLAMWKILTIVFNVVPYVALGMISDKHKNGHNPEIE
ncbi:MAG: DUF6868 family protein [Flavobacteriaceae bacterium]